MRRSISRTVSRYSATRLRSVGPRLPSRCLHLPHHRVQNTALFFDALQAFFGVRAVAEQARENHARIDFHRQRRRRCAPGNRIHVGATESDVAGADQPAEIFGGQFERRQRRLLPDLLRRDLIDRHARPDVGAVGSLGMHAVQEDRRRSRVIAAVISGPSGRGHLVRQIRDHHHLILERLDRRERPRQLEIGAFARGCPVRHHRAMRNEAQTQLDFGIGRGFCQRCLGRDHRIQQWQRYCRSHASQ